MRLYGHSINPSKSSTVATGNLTSGDFCFGLLHCMYRGSFLYLQSISTLNQTQSTYIEAITTDYFFLYVIV